MKEKPSLILPDVLLIQSDICSDIILACEIRGWERKKAAAAERNLRKTQKALGSGQAEQDTMTQMNVYKSPYLS